MLKIKTVFVNKSHEKINKCVSHVLQNIVSMLSFVLMNVKKKKNKKRILKIRAGLISAVHSAENTWE